MRSWAESMKRLLPQPAVLIADVVAVHEDQTSTVQFPDGSVQRVRGTTVSVGQSAFIRAGVIEGIAPARVAVVIEV